MDVFDRYAPFIQEFIYTHRWESLRGVQVAAADAIFNTDDNVLLCASTASGKTEAAFFPILTEFWEDPPRTVGAIYVGPLKALINDQFIRLDHLCAEASIPVWRWHGDVSQSHKAKLLKRPSGILQITPESLESLLLHKHAAMPALFGDLRYVVIDEVHSLLRGDRGGQTLACIERLSRLSGSNARRIGLSATIGDPEATGTYLSSGTGRGVIIPQVAEKGQRWRVSMEHFYITGPQASERGGAYIGAGVEAKPIDEWTEQKDVPPAPGEVELEEEASYELPDDSPDDESGADGTRAHDERPRDTKTSDATVPNLMPTLPEVPKDLAPELADPGIGYVFEHTRNKKCLVFANSREEAETTTATLRAYCEAKGEPDRFLIHHGNLSQSFRETAEDIMRDEESTLTTVTTSTLELGIDIGRLERAFQMDAPFTVSSFLQRMGRTGRRGQPPEMWFVMREEQPEPRTLLPETMPWKLLQGIALVQLYLEERWVEPPSLDRLPFSLLYHQTMATLASSGELTPGALAERVLTLTPFYRITLDDYRVLLRHLLDIDQIERTERGGLIVGLAGERVTNNFRFYATFQEDEEYTCRSEGQELGTVVMPPPVGEPIALAGHVWIVEEIDQKRHLIECTQVKGRVPAYFGQVAGDINTHILERMRQVLEEEASYPYLLTNATSRLSQARHMARIAHVTESPLVNLGGTTWCLFPWLGSYAFLALERLLKIHCAKELGIKNMGSGRPYFIQFSMAANPEKFFEVVCDMASRDLDPMSFVYPGETPYFNKYDPYVPPELIRKGFAYGILDIEGMRERVLEWSGLAHALPAPEID